MKTTIRCLFLSCLIVPLFGIGSLALAQKATPLSEQEKTVINQGATSAPASTSSAVKTLPATKSVKKKSTTSTSTATSVTPKPSTTVKKTATIPVKPSYTPPAAKAVTKPSTSTATSVSPKPSTGIRKTTAFPVTPPYTTPAVSVPQVSGKPPVQSGAAPITPRSGYVVPSFTSTPAAGSTGVGGQGQGAKSTGTYVTPSYTPPALSLPSKTVGGGTAVQGQEQGIKMPSGRYVTPMYDPPPSGPFGSGASTGQPGSVTTAPRSSSLQMFPVSGGTGSGGQEQGTKTPGTFLVPSSVGGKEATLGSDTSPSFSGSTPPPAIDNTERLRQLREKYGKAGTASGNESQAEEDLTTPTPKTRDMKELPPQRLDFQRPQSAKGGAEVEKRAIQWGSKDQKGTEGDASSGGRGSGGGSAKAEDMMGPSPIPKDLKGQTDVGKGPGGKVIGWGDGIYGVDDKGTGIPSPPAGAEELDKLLETGMRGPSPGSEAGGIYGPTRPGIGPRKWASDPGSAAGAAAGSAAGSAAGPTTGAAAGAVAGAAAGAASGAASGFGGAASAGATAGVSTKGGVGKEETTDGSKEIESIRASCDNNGSFIGLAILYRNGDVWYRDGRVGFLLQAGLAIPGSNYSPEGDSEKPSPKTPDPNITLVLMKAPPGRHTDPRIGKVGDPSRQGGEAAGDGKVEAVAAGAAKAEAKWQFAGVKPGAFLKGPRDPDLPGGGGGGKSLRPDLRRFILPDPPEAEAIGAALAKTGTAGASSATVSEVAGGVQVLTTQEGRQGWTPLAAGSELADNAVIKVENGTGGQVGVGDVETALSMIWRKIHSGPNHDLYQLQLRK